MRSREEDVMQLVLIMKETVSPFIETNVCGVVCRVSCIVGCIGEIFWDFFSSFLALCCLQVTFHCCQWVDVSCINANGLKDSRSRMFSDLKVHI